MPGEIGVAQAMAGRGDLGDLRRAVGIHHRLAVRAQRGRAEFDEAHAAVAGDRQLRMIAIMRHLRSSPVRTPESSSSESACPKSGPACVFGTSISRPSTLTLIFSIAGGAGFVSVVAAVDIAISDARRPIRFCSTGAAISFARRSSSASPLATNSSLNFATKLCTGQEQASPNAQIVRPPGMLSAIFTR